MTLRRTIELIAFALALLIAAMTVHAWLASRDEQQRLATTLGQQKQLLDAADARERTRKSVLAQTLAQIESLKRATQTPQQIVSAIPQFVSLPQPITLSPSQQGTNAPRAAAASPSRPAGSPPTQPSDVAQPNQSPDAPLPSAPTAQIPAADLKPLYNYIQDCRACQAQLAAANQNAAGAAAAIVATRVNPSTKHPNSTAVRQQPQIKNSLTSAKEYYVAYAYDWRVFVELANCL